MNGGGAPGIPWALLGTSGFLRLWLVGGIANAMRWLEMLAVALFTYELTGSGFAVALITAARTLPHMFVGPISGVMADSLNRRLILAVGLALIVANAVVLSGLVALGVLRFWHVIASSLVSGVLWGGEMATRRRMIVETAGVERTSQAVALDSITMSITRMLGPIAGGIAFEFVGLGGAFAISATLLTLCFVMIWGMEYRQETRKLVPARILTDIVEGFAIVRRYRLIVAVLITTMIMNVFGFSYASLLAPIGREQFGVSPTLVGLLAAAEPAGSFVAGLILASGRLRLPGPTIFFGGTVLFLGTLAVAVMLPWYWAAFALLLLGGLGTAGFGNTQTTVIMTEVPRDARSRVLGIVTMCIGVGPLGTLVVGMLADMIGASRAVLILALIGLAGVALVRARWRAGFV